MKILSFRRQKNLLTFLIGDAKREIERIWLADANYDVAEKTYLSYSADKICSSTNRMTKSWHRERSSMDIEWLCQMYKKVQFRISAMKAPAVKREPYGLVLTCVLLRCLRMSGL